MFLKSVLKRNRPLAAFAFQAHEKGLLAPDTYILDLDAIRENAGMILSAGNKHGIHLYFMLKQLGRNPLIAKMLMEMGYEGAVCVDFREALLMLRHGIPLGNVGHLVQTPRGLLPEILAARPKVMTIYSYEKAKEISEVAKEQGFRQDVLLRVFGDDDIIYPGQRGGFPVDQLVVVAGQLRKLKGIRIAGVCSFPCFLYNEEANAVLATPNMKSVLQGAKILQEMGFTELQLNCPSVTGVRTIPAIARYGGTHGEPGHSLTGTTPYHADPECEGEIPALVYLSEISHNMKKKSFIYGGGYYRRGHLENALTGTSINEATLLKVAPPPNESIDYTLELRGKGSLSDPVVMSFRTQIFVTRSEVAVVSGLSRGNPQIEGIWSPLGERLR